jgi:hypothetical protein
VLEGLSMFDTIIYIIEPSCEEGVGRVHYMTGF